MAGRCTDDPQAPVDGDRHELIIEITNSGDEAVSTDGIVVDYRIDGRRDTYLIGLELMRCPGSPGEQHADGECSV